MAASPMQTARLLPLQEDSMPSSKGQFRIELTPEQKERVRAATGKNAEAVELSVEELEERIAPAKPKLGLGGHA